MESRLENKLGMFQKVLLFLNDNQTTLSNLLSVIPALTNQISTQINNILTITSETAIDLRGYTIVKADSRKKLEMLTLKVARAISSYASLSNNSILKEKANYTKSDFERAREHELYTLSTIIYEIATPIQAQLTNLLVTANDINDLNIQKEDFLSQLRVPKEMISIRKTYTEYIKTLITETSSLISEQLDIYMSNLSFDYALLYEQYKSSRSIDAIWTASNTETITNNLDAETTTVIFSANYDSKRTFVLKNKGNCLLKFALSNDGIHYIGKIIDVPSHSTLIRDSSAMASSGNFLLAINTSKILGSYEVIADG